MNCYYSTSNYDDSSNFEDYNDYDGVPEIPETSENEDGKDRFLSFPLSNRLKASVITVVKFLGVSGEIQ